MHNYAQSNQTPPADLAELAPTPEQDLEARPLIAQLTSRHRRQVKDHLLRLPPDDRRLRFGHAISDESIVTYVRGIHFGRDAAFGAFDERGELTAFGHLAFTKSEHMAELGMSVAPEARRRGIGLLLLERAGEHARNRNYRVLMMAFVPENTALAALARRAGMRLVLDPAEPHAYLGLEPPDAASVLHEAWDEAVAAIDLGLRRVASGPVTSA